MKHILFISLFLSTSVQMMAQFQHFFEEKTLRLDYYHCGSAGSETFYFDELIGEKYWGGSKTALIDTMGYGNYFMEVRLPENQQLIFSRGFSTLFSEWQTTPEAKTIHRCYNESLVMPFPRQKVVVSITSRNQSGVFEKKFEHVVDPNSYFIKTHQPELQQLKIHIAGKTEEKVDVVLLPEGYTREQKNLFTRDCQKFAESFFAYSPYSENKDQFNFRGVWAPSIDEGTDIPGLQIWNQTVLESSFYTFDSERYLMVDDFQKIRDVAGNVPYDFIYILTNTEKYGGGAIYNFYGISAAHHPDETAKIFIHEFGHLFAGLGDEYVGGVEYNEFYPAHIEPWEPNLTTLVDFDQKWNNMLPEGTPIPSKVTVENAEKLGVYEGGGYVSKGVYRPWINCLMNNLHTIDVFCPVCSKAIQDMIDFQCK